MKYYCYSCCLKMEDRETLSWHKSLDHDVRLIDNNNPKLMRIIDKLEYEHDVVIAELRQTLGV